MLKNIIKKNTIKKLSRKNDMNQLKLTYQTYDSGYEIETTQ
jgi:hypothetical protein